ncbi:PREDICTED: uncharacterized protein LOC105453498 isoform X2 [Wasmannia auropunctata]|nr:PREDICTED: uncharacterized protein LOC105453498 isoform X2 [Wasmannia auropunctata]
MVSYLMSHDFLTIAKNALTIPDNPRLTEIILGIIGNLCSNEEVIDKIGCDRELVTQLLSYLKSNDSLILIQLVRILQSAVWKIGQDPQSNWVAHLTECEFFGKSITFILDSSTKYDLLKAAICLLESISQISLQHEDSFFERLFRTDILFHALLESYIQVIPMEEKSFSQWTFVGHWLAVLIAVMKSGSLKFEDDYENDKMFKMLMEIMFAILKSCKKYNLYPVRQQSANIICDTVRVLLGFRRCDMSVQARIDCIVAKLIFSLKTVSEAEAERKMDSEELKSELLDYLIKYCLQTIELCTSEQILEILSLCKCEVRECLISLLQPKMRKPEMIVKMKIVACALEKRD